ncbi:MAG: DUF5063 domain-containing protein [Paludibacteraceae bacterium]|jgi:hypothetical protein|nr:DUF5063 domain-containing protein [Paludibacteraceae bacterium]HOI27622.1 DUF5063 domain-containing protein [Paludibacteraceae bacterium]HPH63154.1 DUF5063 domain-containing protein [Paludibacteraceae bacterium]
MGKEEVKHPIYSNNVIEFVTVAAEYCSFLEKMEQYDEKQFVDKLTKLLPLLYLKASLLPDLVTLSVDDMPHCVTEEEYEYQRGQLLEKIGRYDEYLEVFNADMKYSDTPVVASISEDLTDIYQDLKDMVANFKSADLNIMNDAILNCKTNFKEFWGQKALNALRALHNALYSTMVEDDLSDEEETFDE